MKIQVLVLVAVSALMATGSSLADHDKSNGKGKPLPPGLQKNYERGKPLPPGWQKKLSPGDILGSDIYARGQVVVPLGDDGLISINVEGTVIRLRERTREIIDILGR